MVMILVDLRFFRTTYSSTLVEIVRTLFRLLVKHPIVLKEKYSRVDYLPTFYTNSVIVQGQNTDGLKVLAPSLVLELLQCLHQSLILFHFQLLMNSL
jgi:hypothetical protein